MIYTIRLITRLVGRVVLVVICLGWTSQAEALIVASGNSNNNEASIQSVYPAFPYWGNIGRIGNGTGVYLGDGLVITARHVGTQGGGFVLNGTNFPMTAVGTLSNPVLPGNALSAEADLRLFRLNPGHGLTLPP